MIHSPSALFSVGGIRGIEELQRLVTEPDGWAVAFCMFPVSIDEVMRVADAEKLMPPKVKKPILYLLLKSLWWLSGI